MPRTRPFLSFWWRCWDLVFLAIEARRYRYFDIWRTRVRQMEVSMYGPLLRLEGVRVDNAKL